MRITDPQALRAMSHPLRLDLIELLAAVGPATAATCARHLGTSQASCSFHLRQLAKYGFVEQAADTGDKRERPWRVVDNEQSWSSDAGPAGDELERVFVQREADRVMRWIDTRPGEADEWLRASFFGGATLPVTVEEAKAIADGLRAVLAPYIGRLDDPSSAPKGARFVRFVTAGTPIQLGDPPQAALSPEAHSDQFLRPSGDHAAGDFLDNSPGKERPDDAA
jgi:DNA-binding transcriptional ArsR family regulator